MKPRKPLKKISDKRLKTLKETNGNLFLQHNSTIRRKPWAEHLVGQQIRPKLKISKSPKDSNSETCNAITADRKYENTRVANRLENTSSPVTTDLISVLPYLKHAGLTSRSNFGKQRKPVNKQSAKQRARLQRLAQVRERWWKESQSYGETIICGICDEPIWAFEDLASDHRIPGTFRDDSEINLQPSHGICNLIKSSQRNFKIVRGDRNWRLIHGLQ